jgi:tetratricopeptide (TPR) repeat protein
MEHEIRTLRAHFWSDRDPDGRAFAPLAEAYLNRGDVEEALALVQDGLGRLPDYATGHLVAARVHRVRGDQAAARGAVEALLALDRGNAPGLRLLGEISEEAGEVQAAIDAFREALERDPGYADLEGRIARLGYPATEDDAGALTHPGDAEVDDPGGNDAGRKGLDAEAMAEESSGPLEPGSAALESLAPESLAHGPSDADEEGFQIDSFEPVHGDMEELDSALRSGPEPEFDSELDFESDSGSDPFPSPSLSPSEDLIFQSFDDPFEDSSEAEASSGEPAPPLATRTMAELYIRQGFTDRGLEVYRQLVGRDPENPELRRRLEELESVARGETPGEDVPVVGAAAPDAPATGGPPGIGDGTPGSEGSADGGADGNERASPASGGEEDDPWGSAPQWTGGDPETAATDRSPFAWVPDPEDAEGEEMSEIQGLRGEAVQEAARGSGPSAGRYLQDLLAWEPEAVPIESLAPEADQGRDGGGNLQEESLSNDPGDERGQGPSHPGSRGE